MNGHEVIWTQPPSLLTRDTARVFATPRDVFEKPAILRFTTDAFMDEFLTLLDTRPHDLRKYKVRRETWRGYTPMPVPQPKPQPSLVLQRLGLLRRSIGGGVALAEPTQTFVEAMPPETPLKLYQPAHQRHYLVACSLVCKVTGLPDRTVEPGRGEQTGFLVRRLLPPAGVDNPSLDTWEEYAWVAREQGYVWRKVLDPLRVVEGEEKVPLFAVNFAENDRRKRRLFAGVIPVGRREAYLGAPKTEGGTGTPGVTLRTARKVLLRKEVIEPWKSLVRRAAQVRPSLVGPFTDPDKPDKEPKDSQKAKRLKIEREQIQTASWYILLDFAKYLSTYLRPVWRAVLNPAEAVAPNLSQPELDLIDAFDNATTTLTLRQRLQHNKETSASGDVLYQPEDVLVSLRDALVKFGSAPEGIATRLETQLDRVVEPYDRYDPTRRSLWPSFLFPLADPHLPGHAPIPRTYFVETRNQEEKDELELDEDEAWNDRLERLDRLAVLVVRALRDDDPQPPAQPAVPTAAVQPANALEGWFVLRCVYDRPACEPLHGHTVSEPTDPFQMAGFFDPDAPARPIRIGLPLDTTPAGLRKFDKNTAFVISDTLCGQIKRLRGLTLGDLVLSVLPWPFHKDLPDLEAGGGACKTSLGDSLGMICSLSIPIVTICALILLIIMVSLLDFIFRWLPYFFICFPLPGLRAKPKAP